MELKRRFQWMTLTILVGSLFGLLNCGGDDTHSGCTVGETKECFCSGVDPDRGIQTCGEDGLWSPVCNCDCPVATTTCVGDSLSDAFEFGPKAWIFDVDTCGNVGEVAREYCWCGCASDGKTCADSLDPMDTFELPTVCHDRSSCIIKVTRDCEAEVISEGFYGPYQYGHLFTNSCNEKLRCWVRGVTMWSGEGEDSVGFRCGSMTLYESTATDQGYSDDFGIGFGDLGESFEQDECRDIIAPSYFNEVEWVCVPETDDLEQCLPELPRRQECTNNDLPISLVCNAAR